MKKSDMIRLLDEEIQKRKAMGEDITGHDMLDAAVEAGMRIPLHPGYSLCDLAFIWEDENEEK